MRDDDSKLDWWYQSQMLRQEGEMDCGVCVFGALAGLSRDEILRDLPDSVNGKTVDQWSAYLEKKGHKMIRFRPGDGHPLPCAHLHEITPDHHHWIYQATDGGIHDPSPSWQYYPPKLMSLSFYNIVLTVALESLPDFE